MLRFNVALITCVLFIPIVGSAQDFDFEGASAQELVQEWVRLTGEPGHRFVHYATYITSVMISDDARAEELTDLVFEHAALTPSKRIAESASNILIYAEKQMPGRLTARVSQALRDSFREGSENAPNLARSINAASTQLKAQVLGWVVPMISQGEVPGELEVELTSALPLLGEAGMEALRRLLADDAFRTETARDRARLIVALSGADGGQSR